MQNPRIVYLKNLPKEGSSMYIPCYWKVIEGIGEEKTSTLFVTKTNIEAEEDEEFFEQISFIKNKLCENNIGPQGCEEITKEKFDAFFINTVSKINELSKI